jgi:hypothetical protein
MVRYKDGIAEIMPVRFFIGQTERLCQSPEFGLVYPLDRIVSLGDDADLTHCHLSDLTSKWSAFPWSQPHTRNWECHSQQQEWKGIP